MSHRSRRSIRLFPIGIPPTFPAAEIGPSPLLFVLFCSRAEKIYTFPPRAFAHNQQIVAAADLFASIEANLQHNRRRESLLTRTLRGKLVPLVSKKQKVTSSRANRIALRIYRTVRAGQIKPVVSLKPPPAKLVDDIPFFNLLFFNRRSSLNTKNQMKSNNRKQKSQSY